MKSKTKHRSNKSSKREFTDKRITIRQCTSYEPDFKKAVVLFAEQRSTSEAKRRYGISESNIRRWRRLKNDILEKASQVKTTRKSKRTPNPFDGTLESESLEYSNSLDSMPLEQRLKTPPEQEPILQSQPLSPTKLKVTRQSTKPSQPSPKPKPVTPEPPNEEVCLRWNSHHSNMQNSFPSLLMKEQYVDATLVAEGQSLKCHRLILSSCSPYFEEVLSGISPFQHPVLFMKDIPFWVLKSLCDFMYAGEVHIFQNKLEELLAVAESLKIKGLAGKIDGSSGEDVKNPETPKAAKEEKREEKEVKEKKRNSHHFEPPAPKSTSRAVRSVHPSKKSEKVSKEPLSKEGILDPLDLLEPVYEEVTKESAPVKIKEIKGMPIKKGKFKKRKFSEEREESPPPMFLSRKGTRSRPNVKIPKYYHTHYERVPESTIVREPHTVQPDPLMQVEEIKTEPLDLDDSVIEIEDNALGFSDVPEIPPHVEEIIGNYDSPLVNLNDNDKVAKEDDHPTFKKISLVAQPIIMNVQSIAEKSPNILEIVDVAQLKASVLAVEKIDDPLATISDADVSKLGSEDPLNYTEKGADSITITNVQSIAEIEESEEKRDDISHPYNDLAKEQPVEEEQGHAELFTQEQTQNDANFHIVELVTETATSSETADMDDVVKNINESSPNEHEGIHQMPVDDINENTQNQIDFTNDCNFETEKCDINLTNEDVVMHEKNFIKGTEEMESSQDNTVELGFHIAKVASEQCSQLSMNAETSKHDETTEQFSRNNETVEQFSRNDDNAEQFSINNDIAEQFSTNDETVEQFSINNGMVQDSSTNDKIVEQFSANDEAVSTSEIMTQPSTSGKIMEQSLENETLEQFSINDEIAEQFYTGNETVDQLSTNDETLQQFSLRDEPATHFSMNEETPHQFSMEDESVKQVPINEETVKVNEDCASELTNVSGQIEEQDQIVAQCSALKGVISSDLETFSNHLSETENAANQVMDETELNSAMTGTEESLTHETQFLAESLEQLLDK